MKKSQYDHGKGSAETLEIPPIAGAQIVTTKYQRRTQLQYCFLAIVGLLAFSKSEDVKIRTLGLGILFPGAGFVAVGGIGGFIGLLVSLAVLPASLFAWFGAGGLGFVLVNWFLPAIIAPFCVGKSVWEPAAAIDLTFVGIVVAYAFYTARVRNNTALQLRDERNAFLLTAENEYQQRIQASKPPGSDRELTLDELRLLQRFVEVSLQDVNDWSSFTVIDQFQTSALRYQLYDSQYTLAFTQKHYLPSFRGYVKKGQENLINKSLTRPVMNFWKWESLWGKFTLNWDPVVRDNIMVTGYLLLCLSLYEKLNGDDRYTKEGAIKFDVTTRRSYRHSTLTIKNALMQNWNDCAYCLFPCEPNWIYSGCNFIGMQGAIAYDSYMHTGEAERLLHGNFHSQLEQEFMNPDGSVVALRSAITGFTVPGLAGVLGDVGGALTCVATLPLMARRLWHVSRNTTVRKDARTGKWTLENLIGADNLDVGNYKSGPGFAWCIYAACAAEFGEEELKRDLIEKVDTELHPIELHNPATGSTRNKGLSLLGCNYAFRARLKNKGDWSKLVNDDINQIVANGPKLAEVPFPAVMVAKCVSTNEKDLDFVLYNGLKPGSFKVKFQDLTPNAEYQLSGKRLVADKKGQAECELPVDGRSPFSLVKASK